MQQMGHTDASLALEMVYGHPFIAAWASVLE
jgi:hypothetical protein